MPLRERELGNDFFCFKAKMSRLNYGEMFDRRLRRVDFQILGERFRTAYV